MHAKGIVHNDVKASNILVFSEGDDVEEVAKLADFGISCGESSVAGSMYGVELVHLYSV